MIVLSEAVYGMFRVRFLQWCSVHCVLMLLQARTFDTVCCPFRNLFFCGPLIAAEQNSYIRQAFVERFLVRLWSHRVVAQL